MSKSQIFMRWPARPSVRRAAKIILRSAELAWATANCMDLHALKCGRRSSNQEFRLRLSALIFVILATAGNGVAADPADLASGTSIQQYGITWTFSTPVQKGQFVNGDWWVVGPATVSSVSPGPLGQGIGARNGSVVNPTLAHFQDTPFTAAHFDGRMANYSGAERVNFPLSLKPGQSLVSTESVSSEYSMDAADQDPEASPFPAYYRTFDRVIPARAGGNAMFIKNAAILTCLISAPPPNSFRPPYVGAEKKLFSADALPMNVLPNLAPPRSTPRPPFTVLRRCFQRPWTDIGADYLATEQAASQNMAMSYGREFCRTVGDAMLVCCCRFPIEQKRPVVIGLVQHGIDLYYGYRIDPDLWKPNGGFKIGRKPVILFAAMMLGEKWILAADKFQEDLDFYLAGDAAGEQLWTGWQRANHPSAANVLRALRCPRYEHLPPDQWHALKDQYGHPLYPWDKPESYARQNSRALVGVITSASLLGLQQAWNNDAPFLYIDRWMNENDSAARMAMASAARAHNWDVLDPPGGNLTWTDADGPLYMPHNGEAGTPFQRDMYVFYRKGVRQAAPARGNFPAPGK